MSCTELAAVAATVMPDYEGRVVYVDAVTTERSAESVIERYAAQYIPTSMFVTADGSVGETVVGPLTEPELRARLDTLVATGAP